MQEKLNESIDTDYCVVQDSYFGFMIPRASYEYKMKDSELNMTRWYESLLSKLNSMRAELSPCQQ